MLRYLFNTLLMILLTNSLIQAEDYLVRLETSLIRDLKAKEQQPERTVLESIEIIARLNQPFYGHTTIGQAKLSFSGIMEQLNDGRFRLQIRSKKSAPSGEFVQGPKKQQIPIYKSSDFDTGVVLELNTPTQLGLDRNTSRSKSGEFLNTSTQTVLSIERFDPSRFQQLRRCLMGINARFDIAPQLRLCVEGRTPVWVTELSYEITALK